MKKTQTIIYTAAVILVFVLSFFIGRASALRDREKATKEDLYTGTVPLKDLFETGNDFPAAAKGKAAEITDKNEKNDDEKEGKPIEKMISPCDGPILKPYSETAVYSETTKDWRAHTGTDYAAEEKDSVKAAANGRIKHIYKDKLWGWCIEIDHGNGLTSVYRNLNKKINVREGEKVEEGQAIALAGKSAALEKSEATHLHFEVRQNGECINPESYIY